MTESARIGERNEVNGVATPSPARALHLIDSADDVATGAERQATYDAARSICVLVLLDAIDPDSPAEASEAAMLSFVVTASSERLAVLLEPTPARDADPIVSALALHGLIDPTIAQQAHLLIDVRTDPG